jgi:proteasome accessory factor B
MDFHVKVSGLGEISWWILGYGDQAEVLQPPALRKRIADRAEQMLSRYNGKEGRKHRK